jgi:hypothetical protein
MADALGAAVMGDDIDTVPFALPFTHMISLTLGVAPRFENGFVRTFRQAGAAGDAFSGN